MAGNTTPSTLIPTLHIEQKFVNTAVIPAVGANAVPHGMSSAPDVFMVSANDATQVVSLISADAVNINFTATTIGAVSIIAF